MTETPRQHPLLPGTLSGDLKPCPFCGGKAQVSRRSGYAFSICGTCHAEGPTARADADHAANAWNRRCFQHPSLEDVARAMDEDAFLADNK